MNKILVIRFSSLGDIALTTPVYRNIKESLPDAHITVLTKGVYADLLQSNLYIDKFMLLGKNNTLWQVMKRVRREKYDCVIDLHGNLRSLAVRLASGAKKKIAYKKAVLARRMFTLFRKHSPSLQRHTVDRYLDTLKEINVPVKHKNPEIYPGKNSVSALPRRDKILIVQTSFIGDIVLTMPMLKAIKEKHKEIRLHLLTTPQGQEMLEDNPSVDKVMVYDKKGKDKSFRAYWDLIKRLKSENYDTALIPHRSFRSALMIWAAGIKERVGFENSQGKIFLTKVLPFTWSVHDLERNATLLKPLGIEISDIDPALMNISAGIEHVDECLEKYGIGKTDLVLGVNPGSIWETKKWPADRYAGLINRAINELGFKVLLFGGKGDSYLEDEIKKHVKSGNMISLIGKTSLKQLASYISRCNLFLTNDSGPMHIAVGLGVPTVAIFGATTKDLGFYPYGKNSAVVEVDLECRPCGLHGKRKCPKGHFNCMNLITIDMVFDRIKSVK